MALGKTVAELEETLGSGELTEWVIYSKYEPFGQWRDNYHAGLIASAIMNSRRKKNSDPVKEPDDFIYRTEKQNKERETRKTLSALNSYAVKAKHK